MRSPVRFWVSAPDLFGDNSIVVPPESIPNSEVKRNRADGSVGSPHVRVGHRQTPNKRKKPVANATGFFVYAWHDRTKMGNKKPERSEATTHVIVG